MQSVEQMTTKHSGCFIVATLISELIIRPQTIQMTRVSWLSFIEFCYVYLLIDSKMTHTARLGLTQNLRVKFDLMRFH